MPRAAPAGNVQARNALPPSRPSRASRTARRASMENAPRVDAYRLALDVDFAGLSWSGAVEIELHPEGRTVSLDCEGLTVTRATWAGGAATHRVDPSRHRLDVTLPGADGGTGPLRVEFSGQIEQGGLLGFYRSRHGKGYALVTQCEPVGARKVFPCIDRPDRKAPLSLTVRTQSGLEVVANAPVAQRDERGDRTTWSFGPTPAMATYLFFLGVGTFDALEDRSSRVALRVLTPPGRGAAGRFALDAARRILAAYEAYYGIPYPLPKLDLLAVSEHAFGAMENWGAMSFRDMRLLVDETTSAQGKDEILDTISHEIAHQWFGNLVTLTDWEDVWLNESFASFLATKIAHQVEPSFDPKTASILHVAGTSAALLGDSLRSTHPVRAAAVRPEEISQIFDEISYGKGSALLGMMEAYLGPDQFRAGVTQYLDRFRYRNSVTTDLWNALSESTGEPVATMLGPWTDRSGLPLVRAGVVPGGLHLRQERFWMGGPGEPTTWPIPLMLEVNGRPQTVRFDAPEMHVPVPDGAVVHLNPEAVGFYRVLYDAELYDRLFRVLPGRSAADRWVVLEDLAAFLPSGAVPWATFERFARAHAGATERLVVDSLVTSLATGALVLPHHVPVQDLARAYFAGQYERIGPRRRPGEPTSDSLARESIVSARVRIDRAFARDFSEMFVEWDRLDAEVRGAAALARARADGASAHREIRTALEHAATEVDVLRLERALAWSADPASLRETLAWVLDGTVNRGHAASVILQAAMNPEARDLTWEWFQRELPRIDQLFRGSGFLSQTFEHAIPYLGLGRRTAVEEYFAAHEYPEGARGLAKGLERLDILQALASRLPRD